MVLHEAGRCGGPICTVGEQKWAASNYDGHEYDDETFITIAEAGEDYPDRQHFGELMYEGKPACIDVGSVRMYNEHVDFAKLKKPFGFEVPSISDWKEAIDDDEFTNKLPLVGMFRTHNNDHITGIWHETHGGWAAWGAWWTSDGK